MTIPPCSAAFEEPLAALAFDHSPVATIYTERRVIWCANRAFADMFGFPRDAIVGLTMELFYPSREGSERIVRSADGPLHATGYHADERTMQRQDGSLFWCAVTLRRLHLPFCQGERVIQR